MYCVMKDDSIKHFVWGPADWVLRNVVAQFKTEQEAKDYLSLKV